jgi:hypothetical protein
LRKKIKSEKFLDTIWKKSVDKPPRLP